MFLNRIFTFILSCLIWASCSQSQEQISRDTLSISNDGSLCCGVNDPLELKLSKAEQLNPNLSDLLDDDYRLIALETHDDCLIGSIDKILEDDSSFFILDASIAKQVFQFDKQGKFIRKIGLRGRGPGEIDVPLDFSVSVNGIFILDRQSRIHSFDKNGQYLKQFLLPFQALHLDFLKENSLFIYSHEKNSNNFHSLVQVNEHYEVISRDFELSNRNLEFLGIQQSFSSGPFGILFSKFYSDTLFNISNNEIHPKYVIRNSQSKKELHTLNFEELKTESSKTGSLNNWCFAENSQHLIFTFIDGSEIHYGLYRKDSDKLYRFSSIRDDLFLGAFTYLNVVGMLNDDFVMQIYPDIFSDSYESIKKSNNANLDEIDAAIKHNLKGLENLKSSDNPVLLLTKFR